MNRAGAWGPEGRGRGGPGAPPATGPTAGTRATPQRGTRLHALLSSQGSAAPHPAPLSMADSASSFLLARGLRVPLRLLDPEGHDLDSRLGCVLLMRTAWPRRGLRTQPGSPEQSSPSTWSFFFPPEDVFHVPTLALVISASRMPSSPQSSLTHPAPLASFPARDQEAGCCLLAALGRSVPQLGGRGEHDAPPNERQAPGRQGPSLLLLSSSQCSKEPCTEQDLQWPPRLSPLFLWSLSFCHLCHHHY